MPARIFRRLAARLPRTAQDTEPSRWRKMNATKGGRRKKRLIAGARLPSTGKPGRQTRSKTAPLHEEAIKNENQYDAAVGTRIRRIQSPSAKQRQGSRTKQPSA